ncbi:DUF1775 domain-containing protein [Solwaraspora sp. WMMD791]|uniref:DUF1775 domain-containing protein n=1 Tax=Solwaraspora sp. WMMD791 TaxID=3016086 RepID=UPI002499C920|nr:DUF1775 domain-containing protein [Solwaraspora sp. WMMD791]WFE26887.1 DUF1775 domain-containing protein [Solwaraspora sp. WMMD791]
MTVLRRRAVTVLARATLGLAAFGLAAFGVATPALAHTQLAGAAPNGAGATTLTFTFDHGCANADTTELTVDMPEGAIVGTAVGQPDGWTADVTPRRVTWTGPPIGDEQIAAGVAEFAVLVRLTGRVGQTFWFPAVQRCADGDSYDWSETRADAERPAPSLIATNAVLAPAPTTGEAAAPQRSGGASLPQALTAAALLMVVAGAAGHRWARWDGAPDADLDGGAAVGAGAGVDAGEGADGGADADAGRPPSAGT